MALGTPIQDTMYKPFEPMKKLSLILAVFALCFVGAFAGLRTERLLAERGHELPKALSEEGYRSSSVFPVDFQGESGGTADFRGAAKRLMPSVVSVDRLERVLDWRSDTTQMAQTGTGSGVIIDIDGTIVTNNHVVANAEVVNVRLSDQRTYAAKVLGTDPRSDIAVIKIDAKSLVPARLGDSKALDVGEWVIAIGNPLGLYNTVSVGVVSSLNRTISSEGSALLVDSIQTDAAINAGNSGGALANARGEVVGINSAIARAGYSEGNIGIGFAIPMDRVKRVASEIIKYGRVRYGLFGVSTINQPGILASQRIRDSIAQEVGSEPPTSGIVIRGAIRESPAAQLGLQYLDILLALDGNKVSDPIDYNKVLLDKKPGDKLRVKYWSRGKIVEKTVVLGEAQ